MRSKLGDGVRMRQAGLALLLMLPWATVSGAQRLSCFATVPPVAGLVEEVGGKNVTVHVLVPPGQSPHTFSPKPRSMVTLARSQLYFAVGLPFERRIIAKVQSLDTDLGIVHLDAVVAKRSGDADGAAAELHAAHGEGEGDEPPHGEHAGEHAQGGLDPHIWMSPVNAMVMADAIAAALIKADPENARQYRANLQAMRAALQRTHEQIRARLKPFEGKTFYVFHPAFGHFAETYGLKQRAVEISGRSPTPRELRSLIQQAREDGVQILFVQPQFEASSARTVAAAINGSVMRLNPLSKDLLGNFKSIARKLQSSFADE